MKEYDDLGLREQRELLEAETVKNELSMWDALHPEPAMEFASTMPRVIVLAYEKRSAWIENSTRSQSKALLKFAHDDDVYTVPMEVEELSRFIAEAMRMVGEITSSGYAKEDYLDKLDTWSEARRTAYRDACRAEYERKNTDKGIDLI